MQAKVRPSVTPPMLVHPNDEGSNDNKTQNALAALSIGRSPRVSTTPKLVGVVAKQRLRNLR